MMMMTPPPHSNVGPSLYFFFITQILYIIVSFLILSNTQQYPSNYQESFLHFSQQFKVTSFTPNCSRRANDDDPHDHHQTLVSLCALARYEDKYIQEYIDYYTALGVCGFYFYDNSDEFTLQQQHDNWIHKNNHSPNITLIHWPGRVQQLNAYNDCIQRSKMDSYTWAAFFDLDEFLLLRKHTDIASFVDDYGHHGGITVNWIIFGSSNQTQYHPLPVTRRFQYRQEDVNMHIKSILRLADGPAFYTDPHHATNFTQSTSYSIDTNEKRIIGPFNPGGPTDVAALYHFHVKSKEEYVSRRKWGRATVICNATLCPNPREIFFNRSQDPTWIGTVFDDSVWTVLKQNYPMYSFYDCIPIS